MNTARKARYCAVAFAAMFIAAQSGFAKEGGNVPMSDTSQDYTHTLPLNVSGKQGVVGFRLPQAVYLNAHSADLNDVRIFDANGAKLAFALHVPPPQEQVKRLSWPVKIFPVALHQSLPGRDAIELDIRTTPDGNLLSVKAKPGSQSPGVQGAVSNTLVLDLRQPGQADPSAKSMIEALRFTLPPRNVSYTAQVWLEASDDLKRWDTVGTAELSWLVNNDTQTLANDRLEFEPRSFRYARLTWRSGEPVQFAAINAEAVTRTDDAPVLEQLPIQPVPGKEAQDLVYRAAIAIPVEKIGVQFSEANVVMPAAIGSYRELPSRQIGQPVTWKFVPDLSTTFYQIAQDGQPRRSGDVVVPRTHRVEWVLRPHSGVSSGKPMLRLSWQPATLVFLASGARPYTLAFGRAKVPPVTLDLAQVAPGFSAQELGKLEQATAGVLQVKQVAGSAEENSALTAGTSARTRMLMLWGVLLLGVGVLGAMGWRLFKQMR